MSEMLRLREAAERIGVSHQWLRRHVLEVERRTGQAVLERCGQGEKRPTYRVNMGRLRTACPALFDVRDPLAKALHDNRMVSRREMAQVREELEEVKEMVGAALVGIREIARVRR